MGSLKLPDSGTVYVDADCVIYGVEKVKPYSALIEPLWEAAAAGQVWVVSSEILLLETLVKPVREKKTAVERAFRVFLLESAEFRLVPIDRETIEQAVQIRAQCGLKSPDAIHAATALNAGARLFLTNDPAFCRVEGLPVQILSELLSASD